MRTGNFNSGQEFDILAFNQKMRDGYRPPLTNKTAISKLLDFVTEDKQNAFKITVGDTIKSVRQRMNLTQEEVANRAGISRPNYVNMEKGRENLTLTTLYKIAEALECEVQVLFTFKK